MKKSTQATLGVVAVTGITAALAGCSSSGGSDGDTIRVAYQTTATFNSMQLLMEAAKEQFEAANEGVTVELVPIQAEGADYYTKLALMNGSASTAPDVQYEDTFKVQSDAAAGYLLPLDEYLAEWEDWDQFAEGAKQAGLGPDGQTYGVSLGTDTRALWYNTELFEQAGIDTPWEPQSWDDVMDAAERIKAALPDVIPMNLYSGKAAGEAASMQGFQMLLSGTPDWLYDYDTQKWVVGSQGFKDSLQFVADLYQNELGPTPQQALDPNIFTNVTAEWLPNAELAIALDGSWQSAAWVESGTSPWPEWSEVLDIAPMPTQDGQEPGATSMSGGWTLALGANTDNPKLAFDFLTTALNYDNALSYDVDNSQIAVRADVAESTDYIDANPSFAFFSSLVEVTHFRPATEDYDQISNEIVVAMEAVMTGQQSVEDAAAAYDAAVIGIVGEENTQTAD
ncbi:extracellular solute-binding protein [Microbacterium sp. SSW1-59]|uniref:extracellular solute-binding protein n=1 Tax=Microbacterium xanthum TaxID=3079794 RepID=UPI002AD1FA33|nr:extracellular solute-binding protein [Microbacterium sp. SSW1-59]MDZ8201400.1 extracellular solute-binding protein [Microbacterium sp. SSW1-59]